MSKLTTRIKTAFRNRDRNGASILAMTLECIENYSVSGDWTDCALMIALASGSEKKRIEAVFEESAGLRFKADAKQPTGLRKMKGDAGENNNVGLLAQYVEAGVSFNSVKLTNDDEIPALLVPNEVKQRTVEEVILAAVRKVRRDNPETTTDARIVEAMRVALEAS